MMSYVAKCKKCNHIVMAVVDEPSRANEQIADARKICDKATEGPWLYADGHDDYAAAVYSETDDDYVCRELLKEDAQFIAASRTLLPQALDEIERLREKLHDIYERLEQDNCCPGVAIQTRDCAAKSCIDCRREFCEVEAIGEGK